MNTRDHDPPGLTAVILCGGQALRLGGIDKPLQSLAGRPLIERVIEQLAPQVSTLLISANRARSEYRRHASRTIDDGAYAGCGPLAGFAAGMAASSSDTLLCVPGDAPRLPPDLVTRLSASLGMNGADLAYVHDGSGPQPLCCLLRRKLLPDLYAYLDDGGRTPRQWFARHRSAVVDFSDWPRWAWSANTPEEWRNAEQQLRLEAQA